MMGRRACYYRRRMNRAKFGDMNIFWGGGYLSALYHIAGRFHLLL